MMYSNKLAAAIKVAGKVLREFDKDKVYLPFGSEYSIYLKNMNSVRAVAHVTIDGKDVGDGRGFVVPANGTIDIERFITNGNLAEGNRFKFIERTGAVEAHRGVGVEDGLIQVRFQFERKPVVLAPSWWQRTDVYGSPMVGSPLRGIGDNTGSPYYGSDAVYTCNSTSSVKASYSTNASVEGSLTSRSVKSAGVLPQNETGITAPGSISDQAFTTSDYISLEYETYTMVFHILGETEDNREIREAVTVKHKPRCVSCGTVNRHDAKFCSECGTSLQIV